MDLNHPAVRVMGARSHGEYQRLRRLARAGGAGETVWLEGEHLCETYLARAGQPLTVVVEPAAAARYGWLQGVAPGRVLSAAPGLLAGISPVAGDQGIGFEVTRPRPELPARIDHACVVLDRVQDPGNVGALLRTAAAAGIDTAYLLAGSALAWSPKVLRAAQGAHYAMTLHEQVAMDDVLQRLDLPLLTTSLRDAESLYGAVLPQRAAWVFGHEGQGVAPALLDAATQRVWIPQADGVESLNVVTAAAVCLFEQRRQVLAGTAA